MVTQKKSLAVQLLTVVILMIGAYMGSFSAGVQAWLGIASMAITLVLSTFFASGTMPSGWTTLMWVSNIAGVVLQVANALGTTGLVDAQTINMIMIGINILLQVFVKDYAVTPVANK